MNVRKGALFHYAPFILHCLLPEIINDVYKYEEVYRLKNLDSTIGNLSKIYEEVMGNKNIELPVEEYNNVNSEIIDIEFNYRYFDKIYIDKFRDFIFQKYSIDSNITDVNYPEILLIKRAESIELIDDVDLKAQLPLPPKDESERNIDGIFLNNASREARRYHFMVTNGKHRREMDKIDDVEQYLNDRYGDRFKGVFFEFVPFKEQVKYYNNAKVIICVHGGCQVNQLFCKPATKIIEVECNGKVFPIFDRISESLLLNHVKCSENEYTKIINFIEKYTKP